MQPILSKKGPVLGRALIVIALRVLCVGVFWSHPSSGGLFFRAVYQEMVRQDWF